GEGTRGRLTRLVNEERTKAQRVAQGVPVHVYYVGHGQDEVAIADLSKTIKKLPKVIDKSTMAAVIRRIDSVSQSVSSLPIPKGIDSTKVRAQCPCYFDGSFGRRSTRARRRLRAGIIDRISSSFPKHSRRSSSSRTTCLRGFGITLTPRCSVSTVMSRSQSPDSPSVRPTNSAALCTSSSATPYPVGTVSRWRTSISGNATCAAM